MHKNECKYKKSVCSEYDTVLISIAAWYDWSVCQRKTISKYYVFTSRILLGFN